MPKCKNDPTRSYKGTEPSPKGLGYCAHGMKEGDKKKGKDGNMWIIKKIKNGSLRWIKDKNYDINKLYKYLENKLYKWWINLSLGKILVINKKNNYKLISRTEWKKLGNDTKIKYILWSSKSTDILTYFINYILQKVNIKLIEKFIKEKDSLKILVKNFSKLTDKFEFETKKDYILKSFTYEWYKSKKKREIENKKNEQKLLKKFIKSKIIQKIMI